MRIKHYQRMSMLTLAAMLPLWGAVASPAPQDERKLQAAEPRETLVDGSAVAGTETTPSAPQPAPTGKPLRTAKSICASAPLRADAPITEHTDVPGPISTRIELPEPIATRTEAPVSNSARTDAPEPIVASSAAPAPNTARSPAPRAVLSEAALTPDQLERYRGGTDTVTNDAKLNGMVTANSAINIVTGANTITGGAFANVAGVPIVVQNSGANVLIQNSTIINVQIR